MKLLNEVKKLTEKLIEYVNMAQQNPEYKDIAKKKCREEIEIAQILISAKSKSTPLMTQNALKSQIPEEVKKLLLE